MDLFLRMWRPLRGWLLTGVDRIEEPDCVLDRARHEMRELFQQHCQEAVMAVELRNQVRQELQREQKRLARLETSLLKQQGKRDNARSEHLVIEAQAIRDRVTGLDVQLRQAEQAAEDVKQRLIQAQIEIRQRAMERWAGTGWSSSPQQERLNQALTAVALEDHESAVRCASR